MAIRDELVRTALTLGSDDLLGGGAVLDVGCGSGWWLERLEQLGVPAGQLHGVDLLAARVDTARSRVPGASIRVADAEEIPFAAGRFAAVTLFTVLSSISERGRRKRVLSEVRRVLRPGGVVLVWEPRVPTANPHTRSISRGELAAELGAIERQVPITLLPALSRRLGARTATLYPRLSRLKLLRTHRLVVMRP